MTPQSSSNVLAADDPPPITYVNPTGLSQFLLIGDHAGRAIASPLADLGLSEIDRTRHIAWDIGIAEVGRLLAERLDAVFLAQTYSRLVIDCNRDPQSDGAMPEVSDGTLIPGNVGLDAAERAGRVAAVHAPYHAEIAATLDGRRASAQRTIFVALHSFTPMLGGTLRPWHVGVLHDAGDTHFAQAVLQELRRDDDLVVGDNEPYRMDDTDYTVPHHCLPRALPYLEIEVRQDLIAAPDGQRAWADRLARIFRAAAPERDSLI